METNWITENPQHLAAIFASVVVVAWVTAIVMTEVLPYSRKARTSAGEKNLRPCRC